MNVKHNSSNVSLKTSTSSAKNSCNREENIYLRKEIEKLRRVVESLKISVEKQDNTICTLMTQKDKMGLELKSSQKSNRNLQQQLIDERDINSHEKKYFLYELERLSEEKHKPYCSTKEQYTEDQSHSIELLRNEIKSKDVIIYNLCSKYIKVKRNEVVVRNKMKELQKRYKQTCSEVIFLLQENRKYLDDLLLKLIETSAMPPQKKKYLELVQANTNLHYENTRLKVCLLAPQDIPIKNKFSKHSSAHCQSNYTNSGRLHKIYRNLRKNMEPLQLSSSYSDTWVLG